jgi:hypothetical protein
VWYFAYGSNMQRATFRGRRGIEPRQASAGRLDGWRIVFDKPPLIPIGESFANLVAEPGAAVFGVLYEITADEIAHVDLTEGVLIGNYERIPVSVFPLTGERGMPVAASTLVSHRRQAALQPSQRYMELLIQGALEHALPEDYVAYLRAVEARPSSTRATLLRPLIDAAMRRPPSG